MQDNHKTRYIRSNLNTKAVMGKKKKVDTILTIYSATGLFFVACSFIFFVLPYFPEIYYGIFPTATKQEASIISKTTENLQRDKRLLEEINTRQKIPSLPDFDASLPLTNRLLIPSIGVDGEIHEGTNPEEQLEYGIWRVHNFGDPENNTVPIIFAAHRFGYIRWTEDFRKTNSFYYLPQTQPGDTIEIIWNQRKYGYNIVFAAEDTQITDYSHDLILYTCKYFNSPVRILRYADRVE